MLWLFMALLVALVCVLAVLQYNWIGEISVDELAEVVQEAWLSRASAARRKAWLSEHH